MEALLVELRAAQARILTLIEGYEDFARLNLMSAALEEVRGHLESAKRRGDLLSSVIRAITDLVEDGYPVLARRKVQENVLDDLSNNLSGLASAILEFHSGMTDEVIAAIGPERPTK